MYLWDAIGQEGLTGLYMCECEMRQSAIKSYIPYRIACITQLMLDNLYFLPPQQLIHMRALAIPKVKSDQRQHAHITTTHPINLLSSHTTQSYSAISNSTIYAGITRS